tara:strand:- start:750 stop:1181 length:432 start_codon:yes stop_codon:yes gene_type:complete
MPTRRRSRRRSGRRRKGKSTKILNEGLTQSVRAEKVGESDEELKSLCKKNFQIAYKNEYIAAERLLKDEGFKTALKRMVKKFMEDFEALAIKHLQRLQKGGSQWERDKQFALNFMAILMYLLVFSLFWGAVILFVSIVFRIGM